MKKLFISCPMKGRTEEAIKQSMKKMHKIAEAIFDEELEPIDSYIHIEPKTKHRRVSYLGESIKMMADADYFIGVRGAYAFKGCDIEARVASEYDIPMTLVYHEHVLQDMEIEEHQVALGV